jgi:hypothetical protein
MLMRRFWYLGFLYIYNVILRRKERLRFLPQFSKAGSKMRGMYPDTYCSAFLLDGTSIRDSVWTVLQ